MAKNQELEFSTTAGSNTDIGGLGIDEGMPPSRVNDGMRYLMKARADAITRHVAKAAGTYTAVKADHNQYWRCTGAVTLNLTAAATLTSGWCLYVRANGGAVTIDPASTELIDGATTYVLDDGWTVMVLCTGTEFFLMDSGFVTAFARTLLDDADAVAARTTLGVAWELIATVAVTGSSVATSDHTGLSAYRMLRITGNFIPSTVDAAWGYRFSTDNGSSYVSGAGQYGCQFSWANAATNTASSGVYTLAYATGINVLNDNTNGNVFQTLISNWNQAGRAGALTINGLLSSATLYEHRTFSYDSTFGAKDALQMLASSGDIEVGTFYTLEGVRG